MANEKLEIKNKSQEVSAEELEKVAGGSAIKRDDKCLCNNK